MCINTDTFIRSNLLQRRYVFRKLRTTPVWQWVIRLSNIIRDNILCEADVMECSVHFIAIKLPFIVCKPDSSHSVPNKVCDCARLRHKSIYAK